MDSKCYLGTPAVAANKRKHTRASTRIARVFCGRYALTQKVRELGGHCVSLQADVSKEHDVQRLFETVDQDLGTVSVLVNNAGILKTQMRLEEMSADRINSILIYNVTGNFLDLAGSL